MAWIETPDREGVDYIGGSGSASTLPMEEEYELPERAFPFGFQAPEPGLVEIEAPTLSSWAWAEWLA